MGAPPSQPGGYYGGGGAYPAQPGFNPGYGQPGECGIHSQTLLLSDDSRIESFHSRGTAENSNGVVRKVFLTVDCISGYVAPMAAPMAQPSRGGGSALGAGVGGFAAGAATGGLLGYMMGNHGNSGHGYHGGSYGSYGGGGGGDYNAGDMGGGGGYEMSTDFADTAME